MVHKRFAYMMLASIISSQVIAAPIAQTSETPDMCADRNVPWEEKLELCDICHVPKVPKNVWNRYCGVDGPETHERAQGINRRSAAGTEFQPSHPTSDAVTTDGTKATNSGDSKGGAADGTVEKTESQDRLKEDAVNHKPASGVWRRQQQGNHNPSWPKAHQQANGITSPYPIEWRKREAQPIPAPKDQSDTKFLDGVVIHKPVPEVWRGRVNVTLPSAPIVHPQAADISNDDEVEIPAGSKKREANPVPPPEFFKHAHLPLEPIHSVEDSTLVEGPAAEQPAPDSI